MLPGSELECLGGYSDLRLMMVLEDRALCSNLLAPSGWVGVLDVVEGYRRSAW
jgi:hypothetical protein